MSVLESFLPDIWAYIASYLHGEHLGRLIMTGATLLRERLEFPNVVKSVTLGTDFIVFERLPSFLDDFPSLEELSIESGSETWSSNLGLTIDSIPPQIRKLYLSGNWTGYGTELFENKGATLKLKDHLPHLEVLDLWSSWVVTEEEPFDSGWRDNSWMIHSPRSLTSLSLRCWFGKVKLPPSLLHFSATDVELSEPIAKLPKSLQSFLVAEQFRGVDLLVPLLPPSTQKLSLGTYKIEGNTGTILQQLPKSLTWLQVACSDQIDFNTNPQEICHFPSSLTELIILPRFPCSAWPLLPQNLTKLQLHANGLLLSHGFGSVSFDLLPRSISKLELEFNCQLYCGLPAVYNPSYFPPFLAYLSIPEIQLSPEAAKLLPSSLTYLKLGSLCERVCEHLPASLEKLKSASTLMSPNLIKFLPKSLTLLNLTFHSLNPFSLNPWFDNTGKKTSISKLPEYEIHEKWLSNGFVWKDSLLPPKLTCLSFSEADELGDSFLLHQRLPHLTKLSMDTSQNFSDLSIPLLSPNLRVLSLPVSSEVSGKSFEFLPKYLEHLDLDSSESIFDSDIQHLPRTLKVIRLYSAIHLTDLCVPDLPPVLSNLAMGGNYEITPSSVQIFPCPLRSSQTPYSAQFSTWVLHCGEIITR